MRHSLIASAVIAALGLAPLAAVAVTDDEVNRVLQFNFSNPGARSLALGGAFTGLADDATAAYANPAGLTILRAQEVSVEARHSGFDTTFASGGRVINSPYDARGVGERSNSESVSNLSFLSWVIPTERATFALYYHRLADFEGQVDADAIQFSSATGGATDEYLSASGRIGYEVENFGAAAGIKLSEEFSIGVSVAYSDFSIDSLSQRFLELGEPPFNEQRQNGSDHDLVYSLGALWQINPQWTLGGAYRSGGDFDYAASNIVLSSPVRLDLTSRFQVPDVLSAGLAFRPDDAWVISLDVNRIEYSRVSDGLQTIFDASPNAAPQPLAIDDGTEIRLGAEYAFLNMATPLYVRGGLWRDPDHRLVYQGQRPSSCDNDFDACVAATLYPEGDDEMHYSLGLGWAFGSRFTLDLAADLSEAIDTYAMSGVIRF